MCVCICVRMAACWHANVCTCVLLLSLYVFMIFIVRMGVCFYVCIFEGL